VTKVIVETDEARRKRRALVAREKTQRREQVAD